MPRSPSIEAMRGTAGAAPVLSAMQPPLPPARDGGSRVRVEMDGSAPNAYVRRIMLHAVRFIALGVILVLGIAWGAAWVGRAEGEGIAEAFSRQAAWLLGQEAVAPSAGG